MHTRIHKYTFDVILFWIKHSIQTLNSRTVLHTWIVVVTSNFRNKWYYTISTLMKWLHTSQSDRIQFLFSIFFSSDSEIRTKMKLERKKLFEWRDEEEEEEWNGNADSKIEWWKTAIQWKSDRFCRFCSCFASMQGIQAIISLIANRNRIESTNRKGKKYTALWRLYLFVAFD